MARTVIVQKTGEIRLPREALEESHISTGKELMVVARAGQILLLDQHQLRRRIKEIDRQQQEKLKRALKHEEQDSFFAGLSFDDYLSLSEDKEVALWNHLIRETELEFKTGEHDIPADFVPARQKRRTGSPPRSRP